MGAKIWAITYFSTCTCKALWKRKWPPDFKELPRQIAKETTWNAHFSVLEKFLSIFYLILKKKLFEISVRKIDEV